MRIFRWKKLVSLVLIGVFCGGVVGVSAFADDDGKDQPPAKPTTTAKIEAPAPLTERERVLLDKVELLLDNVEQLKKRVADLESKDAKPAAEGGVGGERGAERGTSGSSGMAAGAKPSASAPSAMLTSAPGGAARSSMSKSFAAAISKST